MNISIKEAARLMDKAPQFVRIGLQRGLLPFGTAIKNPGGRYSYYISPEKFEEYTGIKLETKKENINATNNDHSL